MINMLSNKQVYEKSEVDGAIAQVNNSIANTSRVLEDKIKESVSALFEYKGPCRYMGSYSAGKYPPYEQCHRNDIIRWTNNKVLQCELTGTHQFKELTDIRAGWVFNLTESCVTDACWVDEYGVTIAENTSIAVVDLLTTGPGLVDGCQWGFDAFADSASSGFHVDDEMSPTSVNPVQNKVITAALNNVGGFIIVDELPEVEYANPRKTYYIDSGNTTAGDSPVALYDGYVVVDGAWCKVATSSFDTIVVDAINLGTTSIKSISTEYYQHATVILDGDGIISFNKGKIKVKIAQTAISSSNYPYYTIEWIDADLTSVGVYTPNYNTLYWEYQHDITPEQKIALHFNGYSPDDKLYIDYTEGDVYFSVVEEHYPITTGTQIQHGVTGVQEPIHVDYSNVSGTPDMSNYVETAEKGASNGVATLDATGRVPYTQLPESAMEFKGGWDASTNNPELKDGTGVNGDFYVCSVAGTVNFGTAGSPRNVTFYANDRALYDGTRHQWIRLPASEVRSVNGMSGDVELDIPAAQVNSDWNATTGKAEILNKPSLATVATSGSYNDLSNKPSIPAAQVNSDWNATSGKAEILNKPTLATVATSGSYNDLSNKPSIPAAQVNSDWNATSGKAEILNKPTIPTSTRQLTNDSNFTTTSDVSTAFGLTATNYGGKAAAAGTADSANLLNGFANFSSCENNVAFRTRTSDDWNATMSHQTMGNEALVFATKNDATSFMFVNGEDSIANHSNDRWASLVPGLQIKNNCVAIGKLIGNQVTPSYALDVNGTVNASAFNGNASSATKATKDGNGNEISTTYAKKSEVPTKVGELTNDLGFITSSGSITGSSGSCTGNSATATNADKLESKTWRETAHAGLYVTTDTRSLSVASYTFTLTAPAGSIDLAVGSVVRITFLNALQSSRAIGAVNLTYGGRTGAIKVARNNSLLSIGARKFTGGAYSSSYPYKVWDNYTTLELMWTGSEWLIMGNPTLCNYASTTAGYTVKANGLIIQYAKKPNTGAQSSTTWPVQFSLDSSYIAMPLCNYTGYSDRGRGFVYNPQSKTSDSFIFQYRFTNSGGSSDNRSDDNMFVLGIGY